LADILKGISGGGRLLFAWVFPSAIAIGVVYGLVLSPLGLDDVFGVRGMTLTERAIVLAVAATTVGLIMSALSTPLYRLLEGYSWPTRLQAAGKKRQRARRTRFEQAAGRAEQGLARALAIEALQRFPKNDDQLAPTRLGNALRAFETYGVETYRLDSQSFWTELVAVAPDSLRQEVSNARASVDFFVALFYLSLFSGLLCVVTGIVASHGPNAATIAIGAGLVLSMLLWYRSAVTSSSYWDTTVQALVNLGRKPLAAALGLSLPASIEKEREMWTLVIAFNFYGYKPEWADQLDEFRIGSGGVHEDVEGKASDPATEPP
jgi:hypothetical protein